MLTIYCRGKHGSTDALCPECRALFAYAMERLSKCSFGAKKPNCSDCPIHCYKPVLRTAILDVMRYAGPRMLVHHPVLALKHSLEGMRNRPVKTKRSAVRNQRSE